MEWTCQAEGPSHEDYFRSARLRSWGRMAWSVERGGQNLTIRWTVVQEPLYLFFVSLMYFSSDFNKYEQTIWTTLCQNSQIDILLFHYCLVISLYWLWFLSFHSSKNECSTYSSHTFFSFERPKRNLWLIKHWAVRVFDTYLSVGWHMIVWDDDRQVLPHVSITFLKMDVLCSRSSMFVAYAEPLWCCLEGSL